MNVSRDNLAARFIAAEKNGTSRERLETQKRNLGLVLHLIPAEILEPEALS